VNFYVINKAGGYAGVVLYSPDGVGGKTQFAPGMGLNF
jgi:hypothetical protein